MTSTTTPGTRSVFSSWLWIAWLLGPGSFIAAYLYCSSPPKRCTGPPDLGIACMLTITHLAASLITLVLTVNRGGHRRAPEIWILIAYWVAIGAWLIIGYSAANMYADGNEDAAL